MASLIEFHKWIGERIYPYVGNWRGNCRGQTWEELKVEHYKLYLQQELKMDCCDNGTWSHWGYHTHDWNGHFGNDCFQPKKPKKIDIRSWLRKTHPDIFKEYQKEV